MSHVKSVSSVGRHFSGAILLALVVGACVSAAQPPSQAPKFDGGRAFDDLKKIAALGPKPAGSPALQQTRDYIRKELEATGLTVVEQPFDADTPLGRIKMVNVRATIPGKGPGRILVTGHYDTKPFKEFAFVGANDGGSSAAFLIELARALKGRSNPLPIELVFLDGEESTGEWQGNDHTYGSRYYVQAAKTAGDLKDIRAMILVDMIGDAQLEIKREGYSTPWLTDAIWSAAK
jgi:glutaminyl-peptide cyclotransferase